MSSITAESLRSMSHADAMRVALDAWNAGNNYGDGFECSVGAATPVLRRQNNSEVDVYHLPHGTRTVAPGLYAVSPAGWAIRIDVEVPGQ